MKYSSAAYGAAPTYGTGALYGTSVGLNRPMVNVLRDIQAALDPPNSSGLSTTWQTWHWQPCPPWISSRSADFPPQATTQLGYGRNWVTCSDWDGTHGASTVWNGVPDLSLSRLGLSGTMPAAPLCELNASLTIVDLSQNQLTGTIPSCLGNLSRASSILLGIYDNLFVGTVPASLASLSGIALAYNPLLVGQLPAGFTAENLFAWSAYENNFYPAYYLGSYSVAYGDSSYGTGVLRGTSLGHDRPVSHILRDILAALDPNQSSNLSASWRYSSNVQPCPPWTSNNANRPGQLNTTPGYGAGWLGVSCSDSEPYTGGTKVAQIVPPYAGIMSLKLDALDLDGTLPLELRELRTLTSLTLVGNSLSGTIPVCWGTNVTWRLSPPTPGLDSLTFIDLSLNALSGTLPPTMGELPKASTLMLSVIGNQLTGAIPGTYGSLSALAVANNAGLVGTLPSTLSYTKLFAYSTYYNNYYPGYYIYYYSAAYGAAPTYGTGVLYGTSIGNDRPMISTLRDVLSALDPGHSSSLHTSWRLSDTQPCAPYSGSNSATNTQWATLQAGSTGAGAAWAGVTCLDPWPITAGGVKSLLLPNLGLSGTVSCALTQLKTVLTISLAGNTLSGVLPAGLLTNLTSLAQLDVSGNTALCASTTTAGTVIKTGTSTSNGCLAAATTTQSCPLRVSVPNPPPAPGPGDTSCSYSAPSWQTTTFPVLPTAAVCLGYAQAAPPQSPPAPWYDPGVPADIPAAAVTLLLTGTSAASVGTAQQFALTLAMSNSLNFSADAIAVCGVAANGSNALVGVVISGDSAAATAVMAATLLAALPSAAQSGLAAAIIASNAAFSSLASVAVVTPGAMVFGEAAPSSSVGATLLLRGAGVTSSSFNDTAFQVALSTYLNINIGLLQVADAVGVANGVTLSFTIDAASRTQAASLVAALAGAVPSNRSSVLPSLWQALDSSGLTQVTSATAYGGPAYVQVEPPPDGSVPVAAATLLLSGVPLASIGYPEQAALCDALSAALNCAPDQVVVSGLANSTAGVQVGIVIRAVSAAAAAALANKLDYILPVTTAGTSGLANALSGTTLNLASITAVSAANDAIFVGDAAPFASMKATLTLSGSGLSAASFGVAQQAAFAAALSSFLGVSGSAVMLTGAVNANGGVSVSFSVAAVGGVQAAALAATLAAAAPSDSTSTPILWQTITGGGLPQVTSVTVLVAPAAVSSPTAVAPAAVATLTLGGINAAMIGYPEEAAFSQVLAVALNCAADAVFVSGLATASGGSGVQVGVVIRADTASAASALAAALDDIVPVSVLVPNGLAVSLAGAASNLASITAVSASNDTIYVGDAAPFASMKATLTLSGLSAASFGAAQQAAFAAALSSFLGVSGSAVMLTGAVNANGGVSVSFSVAAVGGVQAAALAATLAAAAPSNSTTLPTLWQTITGGGLPQVTSVTALGMSTTSVQPLSSPTSAIFSLKGFQAVSALMMPQQAALLAGVSRLLEVSASSLALTNVSVGLASGWLDITISGSGVSWAPIAAKSPTSLLSDLQTAGLPQLTVARMTVIVPPPMPPSPPRLRPPSPPPLPPMADAASLLAYSSNLASSLSASAAAATTPDDLLASVSASGAAASSLLSASSGVSGGSAVAASIATSLLGSLAVPGSNAASLAKSGSLSPQASGSMADALASTASSVVSTSGATSALPPSAVLDLMHTCLNLSAASSSPLSAATASTLASTTASVMASGSSALSEEHAGSALTVLSTVVQSCAGSSLKGGGTVVAAVASGVAATLNGGAHVTSSVSVQRAGLSLVTTLATSVNSAAGDSGADNVRNSLLNVVAGVATTTKASAASVAGATVAAAGELLNASAVAKDGKPALSSSLAPGTANTVLGALGGLVPSAKNSTAKGRRLLAAQLFDPESLAFTVATLVADGSALSASSASAALALLNEVVPLAGQSSNFLSVAAAQAVAFSFSSLVAAPVMAQNASALTAAGLFAHALAAAMAATAVSSVGPALAAPPAPPSPLSPPAPPPAPIAVPTLYADVLVLGSELSQASIAGGQSSAASSSTSDTSAAAVAAASSPLDGAAISLAFVLGVDESLVAVHAAEFGAAFTLTIAGVNATTAYDAAPELEMALAVALGAVPWAQLALALTAVVPSASGNMATDADVDVLLTSPLLDALDTVINANLTAELASGGLAAALQNLSAAFATMGGVTLSGAPQAGVLLHYAVQCPSPACNISAASMALTAANLGGAGGPFVDDLDASGLAGTVSGVLMFSSTPLLLVQPIGSPPTPTAPLMPTAPTAPTAPPAPSAPTVPPVPPPAPPMPPPAPPPAPRDGSVVTATVVVSLPAPALVNAGTDNVVLTAVQAALAADCAATVPAPACATVRLTGTVVVAANLTLLVAAGAELPASLLDSGAVATLAAMIAADVTAQTSVPLNASQVAPTFDQPRGVLSIMITMPTPSSNADAGTLQLLLAALQAAPLAQWARAGMPPGVTLAAVAFSGISVTLSTTQAVPPGGYASATAAHLAAVLMNATLQASLAAATASVPVVAVLFTQLCTTLTVSSAALNVSAVSCGGGDGGVQLSLPGTAFAATVPSAAMASTSGAIAAVMVATSFDPHATDVNAPSSGVVSLTLLDPTTFAPLPVSSLATPVLLTLPPLMLAADQATSAAYWDVASQAYKTDGTAAVPTPAHPGAGLAWDDAADVAANGPGFAWLPTGPAAAGCRSFALRCGDPSAAKQMVSLSPETGLGKPSVACGAGETRTLRIFVGVGCTLWQQNNSQACWWDVPTQLFAGSGCVADPSTRLAVTHLTDFTAMPVARIITSAGATEGLPPPGPQPAQALHFIIVATIVLTAAMVVGAVLLRVRDARDCEDARAVALSSRCGCTQLPDGLWVWRLAQEPQKGDMANAACGTAVEVAGLLGVPFVRLAAALPEAWVGTAATESVVGISATGATRYEKLDLLASNPRAGSHKERYSDEEQAHQEPGPENACAAAEDPTSKIDEKHAEMACAADEEPMNNSDEQHAHQELDPECAGDQPNSFSDEERASQIAFAHEDDVVAPASHEAAELHNTHDMTSASASAAEPLLSPLAPEHNLEKLAASLTTVTVDGCNDDTDALPPPDACELASTALMHAALLAHGLATSADVSAQQELYRSRLVVSGAAPQMDAEFLRLFSVCTEMLRPGAVLCAARDWWPLARLARVALLSNDAGYWDADDGVATALLAYSAEDDGTPVLSSFSSKAIRASLPLYLAESNPEAALRCWTTALVIALTNIEALRHVSWRVTDELTLRQLGERWLQEALSEQPDALRLQLRAAAVVQVEAWAAAHEAAIAASRATTACTVPHRDALRRCAGGSILTAVLVNHDTMRLFSSGLQARGRQRHQRFLVLLSALLGCLAVSVWLSHSHAQRCCADMRVELGCSDNSADSCLGFTGSCAELRDTHYRFLTALAASDAHAVHESTPHSCRAFPDPTSAGHTFAAGLISAIISLTCVQLAASCFSLSAATDEAQFSGRMRLTRRAAASSWCTGAWWMDGAIARIGTLLERGVRACRRSPRTHDERKAAFRAAGYCFIALSWAFFVWTTLVYGREVYLLRGDEVSVAFQRNWGVAVGVAQAWHARHVFRAAAASLLLPLARNVVWLERTADESSVHATLLLDAAGSAWASAWAFVRFHRAVARF